MNNVASNSNIITAIIYKATAVVQDITVMSLLLAHLVP